MNPHYDAGKHTLHGPIAGMRTDFAETVQMLARPLDGRLDNAYRQGYRAALQTLVMLTMPPNCDRDVSLWRLQHAIAASLKDGILADFEE